MLRSKEKRLKQETPAKPSLSELMLSHSQREIADMFGVTQAAISLQASKMGLEWPKMSSTRLRKLRESAKLAHEARRTQSKEFWEAFDLNAMYSVMNQAQMAKAIGVSQVRISQKLKELGIKKPKKPRSPRGS